MSALDEYFSHKTRAFDRYRSRPICELHCPMDALDMAPLCDQAIAADAGNVISAGWIGAYRRGSGWGAAKGDPGHDNESWRMDQDFARARAMVAG